MARKLEENFLGIHVPDVHEAVGGAGGDHRAVLGPGASQEVLLEVVRVTLEDDFAAILRAVRPNVPDAQRGVHRVGEDEAAAWRERQAGNGVGVALQLVQNLVLPDVPHFDVVVEAAGDDLLAGVVEAHGGHLVRVVHCVANEFLASVPDLDHVVVASAHQRVHASSRIADRVDEVLMAFHLPDPLRRLHRPNADEFVRAACENVLAAGVEVQLHDCAFMSGHHRYILALFAVHRPQEDFAIKTGRSLK